MFSPHIETLFKIIDLLYISIQYKNLLSQANTPFITKNISLQFSKNDRQIQNKPSIIQW